MQRCFLHGSTIPALTLLLGEQCYYKERYNGEHYYKHTAFSSGCYGRLPQEENISPETKSSVIFFLSVVIYHNTLNQIRVITKLPSTEQYVLYYTECPSEGGIAEDGIAEDGVAGCGISLQYHPLLWWVGLRKVRAKYHIYIYQ